MRLATGSSTWRLSQTKLLSSLPSLLLSSVKGISSSCASSLSCAGVALTSSGIAQMLAAVVDGEDGEVAVRRPGLDDLVAQLSQTPS